MRANAVHENSIHVHFDIIHVVHLLRLVKHVRERKAEMCRFADYASHDACKRQCNEESGTGQVLRNLSHQPLKHASISRQGANCI